jgi:hypothetical protein
MSTQPTTVLSFDGYTVRPVTEQDRPYLEMTIRDDPFHRDRMTADYFLKPEQGQDSWAMEDEEGFVLFYFKTSAVVRIGIQFTRSDHLTDKMLNAMALTRGLAFVEAIFQANRFREVLFDTEGPELAAFAKRRMGFTDAGNLLVRSIPPPQPAKSPVGVWEDFPQQSEKAG